MLETNEALIEIKKGFTKTKHTRAKPHRAVTTGSKMIHLDTKPLPEELTVDDLDKYINIQDTLLNKVTPSKFTLAMGTVINIQRAIDFALYPKLLPKHLMMPKLSTVTIKRLGKQTESLPNFWAYIGYVVIERINQNAKLKAMVMSGKPVINVTVKEVTSFKGVISTVTPVVNDAMYLGVVRAVVKAFISTKDVDTDTRIDILQKVIQDLKCAEELSVFSGMNIKTDYI